MKTKKTTQKLRNTENKHKNAKNNKKKEAYTNTKKRTINKTHAHNEQQIKTKKPLENVKNN